MNKTLKGLLDKYGTEEVITRILEQLKILAMSEDDEVIKEVKELITSSGCDTEYIYSLCEYNNFVTYAADIVNITDSPWNDETGKYELI